MPRSSRASPIRALTSRLDIAEAESRDLERRLAYRETRPRYYACDLTDVAAIRALFPHIREQLGPIDVLINNAANDDRHTVEDVTPAYWDERIAVNLRHYFFCAQAVIADMKAAGGGAIVNLGSVSWHLALPQSRDLSNGQGRHRRTDARLGARPRRLRDQSELRRAGRSAHPRQMKLWHTPEEEARTLEQQCLKVRVEPHDVAAMVLFLSSEDARMCTAHEYFVDAGWR